MNSTSSRRESSPSPLAKGHREEKFDLNTHRKKSRKKTSRTFFFLLVFFPLTPSTPYHASPSHSLLQRICQQLKRGDHLDSERLVDAQHIIQLIQHVYGLLQCEEGLLQRQGVARALQPQSAQLEPLNVCLKC